MESVMEELHGVTGTNSEVLCLRWNAIDSVLACGFADGLVRLYNTTSFDLLRVLSMRALTLAPVTSLAWPPQSFQLHGTNPVLGVFADGWVVEWSSETGLILESFRNEGHSAMVCEFSPDGQLLAIACSDFAIRIYETQKFTEFLVLPAGHGELLGHSNRIFAFKWMDHGTLISGGWDGSVLFWDLDTKRVVQVFPSVPVTGQAVDVRENILLVGCYAWKDQIKLFDLARSTEVKTISLTTEDTQGLVYAVSYSQFAKRSYFAVAGSELSVFHSERAECIFTLKTSNALFCCDWGHNEDILAVGDNAGNVRVFKLNDT